MRQQQQQQLRAKNLPWSVPIDHVTRELTSVCNANGWEIEVYVCQLKNCRRKRDTDKHHQGSARVVFTETWAAVQALESEIILSSGHSIHWEPWPPDEKMILEKKEADVMSSRSDEASREKIRLQRTAKRQRRTARRLALTAGIASSLVDRSQILGERFWELSKPIPTDIIIDWKNTPTALDPAAGGRLIGERAFRKRGTVQAVALCLNALVSPLKKIADLGAGAGNVGLALAYHTKSSLLAVDCNPEALKRLQSRAQETSVDAHTLCIDLANSIDLSDCQAVVAVHACGAVSDLALEAALKENLPFFISPCCLGKALTVRSDQENNLDAKHRAARPDIITYPRSKWLHSQLAHERYFAHDYLFRLLASAADYGGERDDASAQINTLNRRILQRRCKRIIDRDRLLVAAERANYAVALIDMGDELVGSTYLKRELLVGIPSASATLLYTFLRRFCRRRRAL